MSEELTGRKREEIEKKYERFCGLFPCNFLALSASRFDMGEAKGRRVPTQEMSLEKKIERAEAAYLGYIAKYPLDCLIVSFRLTIDGKEFAEIPNKKGTEYLSALILAIVDLYEYVGYERLVVSDFCHERRSQMMEYLTYSTADKSLIVAAMLVKEMRMELIEMLGAETVGSIEDWGRLEIRIVT